MLQKSPGRRLTSLLKKALQVQGLETVGITAHSTRKSGALGALAIGIPRERVEFHGTWTSKSGMNPYLNRAVAHTEEAEHLFGFLGRVSAAQE